MSPPPSKRRAHAQKESPRAVLSPLPHPLPPGRRTRAGTRQHADGAAQYPTDDDRRAKKAAVIEQQVAAKRASSASHKSTRGSPAKKSLSSTTSLAVRNAAKAASSSPPAVSTSHKAQGPPVLSSETGGGGGLLPPATSYDLVGHLLLLDSSAAYRIPRHATGQQQTRTAGGGGGGGGHHRQDREAESQVQADEEEMDIEDSSSGSMEPGSAPCNRQELTLPESTLPIQYNSPSNINNNGSTVPGTISTAGLIVVVDTNVFLNNFSLCQDILGRGESGGLHLAVPWMVLDELDGLKSKREQRLKQQARRAISWLEAAAKKHRSTAADAAAPPAVILQKGSEIGGPSLPSNSNTGSVPDNLILDYCLFLRRRYGKCPVLLTADRNLAVKALAEEVKTMNCSEMSKFLPTLPPSSSSARAVRPARTRLGGVSSQHDTPQGRNAAPPIDAAQVEEVRRLCLTFLEDILTAEMEATFGPTWTQIIKVKPRERRPYWSPHGLFSAFAKHHLAVFSINMAPNEGLFVRILKDIQDQLSNLGEAWHELLESLLAMCQLLLGRKTTACQENVARQCRRTVNALLHQLGVGSPEAEGEARPPAQPPDGQAIEWSQVPVAHHHHHQPLEDGAGGAEVLTLLTHVWHIISSISQGMCLALNVPWQSVLTEPRFTFAPEVVVHNCHQFIAAVDEIRECYAAVLATTSQEDPASPLLTHLLTLLTTFKSKVCVQDDDNWRNTPIVNLDQLRNFVRREKGIIRSGQDQLNTFRLQLEECQRVANSARLG